MKYSSLTKTKGFTLIEMTIVLLIVGILIGMLKSPLSQVLENRRISENDLKIKETQSRLNFIQQTILGYVLVNQKLPCPSASADSGTSDASLCNQEGYLPYKDLGLQYYKDSWGLAICYRVDSNYTSNSITATTEPIDNLNIKNAQTNQSLITYSAYPILILYSAGTNRLTLNNQNTCERTSKEYFIEYSTNSNDSQSDNHLIYLSRYSLLYYLAQFNKI